MENDINNIQGPGEESQPQEMQEKKVNYGPLIGSEGEVSGYDWD